MDVATSTLALDQALPSSFDRTVIVAMAAVRMVEMAVDEIINMIAMRHALVTAARTVHVSALMPLARVIGRAIRPILAAAFQHMLINVIAVHMMQVTIVQIVGVPVVLDRGVTAAWRVRVRVR